MDEWMDGWIERKHVKNTGGFDYENQDRILFFLSSWRGVGGYCFVCCNVRRLFLLIFYRNFMKAKININYF